MARGCLGLVVMIGLDFGFGPFVQLTFLAYPCPWLYSLPFPNIRFSVSLQLASVSLSRFLSQLKAASLVL